MVGGLRELLGEKREASISRGSVTYTGPCGSLLRDGERAVDHRLDLLGVAQLVVPLHELAQHAALVEVLLRPVDVVVARGRQRARLGDRRAARGEEDRHVLARGVDEAVHRVRRADADVHHHRLRAAGDHGVAVRHRDAHVLVRHDDDLRQLPAELLALGVRLDDRREVGAAVREQIVDAARGEQAEPGVGGRFGLEGTGSPVRASAWRRLPLSVRRLAQARFRLRRSGFRPARRCSVESRLQPRLLRRLSVGSSPRHASASSWPSFAAAGLRRPERHRFVESMGAMLRPRPACCEFAAVVKLSLTS